MVPLLTPYFLFVKNKALNHQQQRTKQNWGITLWTQGLFLSNFHLVRRCRAGTVCVVTAVVFHISMFHT
jgi:hypothetical protein